VLNVSLLTLFFLEKSVWLLVRALCVTLSQSVHALLNKADTMHCWKDYILHAWELTEFPSTSVLICKTIILHELLIHSTVHASLQPMHMPSAACMCTQNKDILNMHLPHVHSETAAITAPTVALLNIVPLATIICGGNTQDRSAISRYFSQQILTQAVK
jgi:hypothetical protein